jgi:hypothetical protein
MDTLNLKMLWITGLLSAGLLLAGCGSTAETVADSGALAPQTDLGVTIGSMAEIFSADIVAVEGYGLVRGLRATGSAECPPVIRSYLEQQIFQQLSEYKNVSQFINSLDSAVVYVAGLMPTAISPDPYFDVTVTALPGTQTTSLKGGWLYTTELVPAGRFGIALKALATAEGPVYLDEIGTGEKNEKAGYILAGGVARENYKTTLSLTSPGYKTTSAIRNKLNQRFGKDTAKALGPGQIELTVPQQYSSQKKRFISLVKAIYINHDQTATEKRISSAVKMLAVSEKKYSSEITLEAIGNESLGKLAVLLKSSNEAVRLGAARCMLNLGSDAGLDVLRQIASDKKSPYRLAALQTIGNAARRNDAAAISRKLLRDDDFKIRLAAYEQLRKLDDISIRRQLVGGKFYLEQVSQTPHKSVFVSRSGQPKVVIFGSGVYCRDNIFVRSDDGRITINAPAGQKYVSLIREHPTRPNVLIQLKSSFELSDIIRTLCEEPDKKPQEGSVGLGVSYAEMIALLKKLYDGGMVQGQFQVGPMPKLGRIVK